MKLLIIFGTTEGQTRKIAQFLKDEAEKSGHKVTLCDATAKPPSPNNFDAVLMGASVHVAKYQTAVIHYAKEHHEELNKMPSGFFSVSLAAASDDKESAKELDEILKNFIRETGWKPAYIEQVAGALLYTKYDFFKRFIMRLISKKHGGDTDTSQDHEYTDWKKVMAFLKKVVP